MYIYNIVAIGASTIRYMSVAAIMTRSIEPTK